MYNKEIVKIRTKKCYADAANHILVGKITQVTDIFIRLICRTYHYKGSIVDIDRLVEGTVETRIVPWSNVECINMLDDQFDWQNAQIIKGEDGLYLKHSPDNDYKVLLCRFHTTH